MDRPIECFSPSQTKKNVSETTVQNTTTTNNSLHNFIDSACWNEVGALLRKPRATELASTPYSHRNGDYPLHVVCDFKFDASQQGTEQSRHTNSCCETRQDNTVAHSKNYHNGHKTVHPPPSDVVLAVLRAYPEAAKIKGAHGCLPLHNATRRGAPKEVMEALIRAFPQALDRKNDDKITPRDYIQTEEGCNTLLERPTYCWLRHLSDEKQSQRTDQEILQLEESAEQAERELFESLEQERVLAGRISKMEAELERFDMFFSQGNIMDQTQEVCEELTTDLEKLSERIVSLTKIIHGEGNSRYTRDRKDRDFINSYNEDVVKVYSSHLESEMNDFRKEIDKYKGVFVMKKNT